MATSPQSSSLAIPPATSSAPPPPAPQSNVTTDVPSPPPESIAPPPSFPSPPLATPVPTSPPPATPAPASPPPASTASPPPTSPPPANMASPPPSSPPTAPVVASPSPTFANAPLPASSSLPTPVVSSPLTPALPPAPPLSPLPPPLSPQLSALPPPASLPSVQPPSPPTVSPPIIFVPPTSPAKTESPPPLPAVGAPPKSLAQPHPTANPPVGSSPLLVAQSPSPSDPQNPPSYLSAPPRKKSTSPDPSALPPKDQPPAVSSSPLPLPSNSSNDVIPSSPSVPSPTTNSIPPPLPSPITTPGNLLAPVVPGSNRSSNFSSNASGRPRGSTSGGGDGIKPGTVVPIVVVVGLLVLSFVGAAMWFVKKKRQKQDGSYTAGFVMPLPFSSSQVSESSYLRSPSNPLVYHSSGSEGFIKWAPNPRLGNSKLLFTHEQLHKITNGFSANNLLGEGGFGCVYKGNLTDGREVAVKQLKVGGRQGEREFKAEIETISRVHHRHLVSLVGCCIAQDQRLLVYDFVPNNTLHYHLHENGRTVMDWATRVKVATGAARGIAYLHEDCHPRIIHRDIKSSNILLDNNFDGQVSDFGLAKLAIDAATHVTTRVMGTFGYMAPEYASTGKLTDRSDVYSFGVVLLELITGRKPVDQSQPLGNESLVEWARPLLSRALDTGEFEGLPDHRLERNYNEAEMFRMIEVAAACVRHSAPMRPKMGLVVRALDSLADSDLNNGVMPGRSELFAVPQSTELRMLQRMAFGSQDYSIDLSRYSGTSRNES